MDNIILDRAGRACHGSRMLMRVVFVATRLSLALALPLTAVQGHAAPPPVRDDVEIAPRPGPIHRKPLKREGGVAPNPAKADPHKHADPHGKPPAVDQKAHAPPAAVPAIPPPPKQAKEATDPPPKIPRFAAFKTDETNMRKGPGQRYPIEWVYKRRDLPVEVEREYDVWRLVRDPEGIQGWVHQVTLSERRTFIVKNADAMIRADANDQARAIALLKPGVIGRIRSCDDGAKWCQVQVGTFRGYLKREQFWGLLPNEVVTAS